MNYQHYLPREGFVKMADLKTTKSRKGITPLSESTIRRLVIAKRFPQPRHIEGLRGVFYVYGEVLDWLESHGEAGNA